MARLVVLLDFALVAFAVLGGMAVAINVAIYSLVAVRHRRSPAKGI